MACGRPDYLAVKAAADDYRCNGIYPLCLDLFQVKLGYHITCLNPAVYPLVNSAAIRLKLAVHAKMHQYLQPVIRGEAKGMLVFGNHIDITGNRAEHSPILGYYCYAIPHHPLSINRIRHLAQVHHLTGHRCKY